MIMCYITLDLIPIATLSYSYIILGQSFFRSKYRKPSNHTTSGANNSELGSRIGPKGIPACEDYWVYMPIKFGKCPLNITSMGGDIRLVVFRKTDKLPFIYSKSIKLYLNNSDRKGVTCRASLLYMDNHQGNIHTNFQIPMINIT